MPEPAKSVKTNPWIRKQKTTRLSFSPTEEVKRLSATQKANQKIVLSFYGQKIDMPFKLTGTSGAINITTYLADMRTEYEVINSYKVVITHPLGTTHFRLDIPKGVVASTLGTTDAFAIAELNMKAKREFEDYLIQRKQYDLEFSTMDLSHRQARLGRKYEYISKGIDVAMGGIGFIASATTLGITSANFLKGSMQATEKLFEQTKAEMFGKHFGKSLNKMPVDPRSNFTYMIKVPRVPISQKGRGIIGASAVGTFSSASKLASGIVGLASASERAALQEEGFGIQIREKALESYRIDLGFERQKEEQLFTMRRLFANQTYNDVTDRQRQKALDAFETPKVADEIYLELWTTSELQDQYVRDYHDKYGVDCRVVLNRFDTALKIHDEIRVGIYCIEDVVIENLSDRVELEFLKARLTGGIRFVEWVEHERAKELTPTDKRILALQSELAEVKHEKEEQEQHCQDTITRLSKSNESLSHDLAEKRVQYHQLSEGFRKQEAELSEQQKLVGLYRDEVTHLKQDLLNESSKHASEKEEHSGTKGQLETKKGEVEALTKQVDTQLQQIQQKDKRIQDMQQKNRTLTAENKRVKANNANLLKERDEAKRQLETAGIATLQRQIETLQQTLTQEKELKEAQISHAKAELSSAQRELEETKNTLNGVRKINKQLEAEIKEEIWRKKTYTQVMNYHPLKYEKSSKALYPYVITGGLTTDDDKLYICQFVEEKMCYVNQPNLKVKKYSSYAMLIITDQSNQKLLEWNYPLNNWYSYWSENVTKWSHLWSSLLLGGDFFGNNCNLWTTNLQVRVLEPKTAFPCFLTTPTRKTDLPIGGPFKYSVKEGWKGHKETGTYIDKKYSITVNNYGEYLEAMGLEAVERQDGTIEKIVAKKKIKSVA